MDESNEECEPDLITSNQSKIVHFRRLGLFLIHWKKTKYEASNKRLIVFYLLCYLGAFAIFGLAKGIIEIYKRNFDYVDRIDDLIEIPIGIFFVLICPSIWNKYLLREYTINLPIVLIATKKLEKTDIYKKLEFSKNPNISYWEGFKEEDHNDIDDEINIESQKSVKEEWWILRYGPLAVIILSVIACVIMFMTHLGLKTSGIFYESGNDSLKHFMKNFPYFIGCLLYPIPCFISIWFCIFFIEWQRKIYESLRKHIRDIKKSTFDADKEICTRLNENHKQELEDICYMLIKLQKVFILLNKKIFQKTIVISFTLFIFLGVVCGWKIFQDHANIVYILPLLIVNGHIYLLCKWSNDLMAEFNEIMEVLNEMQEEDVDKIRREFNECPPQVMAFGGFSVNYSMTTAVIAFVLSIISIVGMIWPELVEHQDNLHCYEYQVSGGGWNHKICVKDNLKELFNGTGTLSLNIL